ncbi:pseudouridine synthase [Pullulanibacillus camelliae]|uniref:Pseudouridine synthase n=1 Tax=Pullulanibacillus camelliae TaxID=1707096 RepID=A0A8J3E0J6_9BACL|nr:RluA family pseudouridine synthase [Pullulanibacillus camelliae]GGE51324.1 pseudouridine synthase [Pullulanibacillus camelliae]
MPHHLEPLTFSRHVTKEMPLRDFLIQELKLSRTAINKVKHGGGSLLVNGQPVTVRAKLSEQDRVDVIFPPEAKGEGITSEKMPLDIHFEDDLMLILNKPAYLATVPGYNHRHQALANGVSYYLEQQQKAYTAHPVTRLDRNTSGLVLFAKHSVAHDWFVRMQKERTLHRMYLAIVHGRLSSQRGTIAAPIGRKVGSIIERCVTTEGKHAVTHYEVVKEMANRSLIAITLETGRTHQIRVHLSHIGHPLVGDDLYGGSTAVMPRHALHSAKLVFQHPYTNQRMEASSPLPEDMQALLR